MENLPATPCNRAVEVHSSKYFNEGWYIRNLKASTKHVIGALRHFLSCFVEFKGQRNIQMITKKEISWPGRFLKF